MSNETPTNTKIQTTRSITRAKKLKIASCTVNGIPLSAMRASIGRLIHDELKSYGSHYKRLLLDLNDFNYMVEIPSEEASKEKLEVVLTIEPIPGE